MATPHIEAASNDIAKVVLMPGDPIRAKRIATKYLNKCKVVNEVRGMTAYTGYYENKLVTIFPSGMGIPSIGIYAYELFKFYDVDYIIRIGTMGTYTSNIKLGDVVLTKGAYSESSFLKIQSGTNKNYLECSDKINNEIKKIGSIYMGDIYTSDVFYEDDYKDKNISSLSLGVEMETFGLLAVASKLGKNATAILTVTDSFITNEKMSSKDRENKTMKMAEIALKTSLNL